MLDNYELKIINLQYLLNTTYHYKAENIKFSKMHKKKLSRNKMQEFNHECLHDLGLHVT